MPRIRDILFGMPSARAELFVAASAIDDKLPPAEVVLFWRNHGCTKPDAAELADVTRLVALSRHCLKLAEMRMKKQGLDLAKANDALASLGAD